MVFPGANPAAVDRTTGGVDRGTHGGLMGGTLKTSFFGGFGRHPIGSINLICSVGSDD